MISTRETTCSECKQSRVVKIHQFQYIRRKKKHLCRQCSYILRPKRKQNYLQTYTCQICSVSFQKPRKEVNKYCSRECRIKGHSIVTKGHPQYNFGGYSLPKKFCEALSERQRKLMREGKHPWWKGGITPLNFAIRSMTLNKKWKQAVIKRDGYKCQFCGVESKPNKFILMHVDHIKPLSTIIAENNITSLKDARNCKELWDINNGRVLCKTCHLNTDTYARGALNYN